jgi:golgi-specific brefeldin A-resistance guanine nucleotide exchange factor 1
MSEHAPVSDSRSSGQIIEPRGIPIRGLESFTNTEQGGGSLEIFHRNGMTMESKMSVAVDPVALIITECITVTAAMRKHARWAHSSVSAILGGSSAPMNPGLQNSRPSTPRDEVGGRNRNRSVKPSSGFTDGPEDGGLANRWGLRGKKGKSMQDNPLMAGFGRLRRELTGCKGMVVYYSLDKFTDLLERHTFI